MQNDCADFDRQILERIEDGILVLDHDWRLIHLNKAAADMVGKDSQDCLGKVIWDVHPELSGTLVEQAYRAAMDCGKESKFDMESVDGDALFEIAVYPISSGVMICWKDVTDLREATRAFEESETRYQGLFENLHEAVSASRFILDENGEVIDWEYLDANMGVERGLGRRKCGLVGMRFSQLQGGAGIPAELMSAVREIRRTKEPVSIESYNDPLMNGTFHVSFLPLSDDIFYRMSIDITGLKNAQLQAEEGRALLQAILDNTPVAVGITDAKGGVILENGVLEKIWCGTLSLGCMPDYSKCHAWWPDSGEPVAPEDWPAARALKGEASTETFDIEKFDGTRGALIISASPIKDADGNIVGSVWTNQDISDLRRTEEELKRSNADLEQFAYVASHDLQEPLRQVMGHLGLLMKKHGSELGPESARYVNSAIEGAKRMRQLVDDLLAYSRIESEQNARSLVDLNEVAANVLCGLQMAIEEANARVEIEVLPTVCTDAAQMTQVLQNLIGNAIKFRGPSPPHVSVSVRRRSGE